MSDDVILSRAEAKNLADFLRRRGIGEHHSLLKRLDPPQPSLLEEVAHSLSLLLNIREDRAGRYAADAVLALVRKRVADLRHQWGGDGWIVRYDDVLQLLGGGDE